VRVFPDRHGEAPAAINNSGAQRRVDAAAAKLEAYAVQKDGAGASEGGKPVKRCVLRLALRGAMRRIGGGLPHVERAMRGGGEAAAGGAAVRGAPAVILTAQGDGDAAYATAYGGTPYADGFMKWSFRPSSRTSGARLTRCARRTSAVVTGGRRAPGPTRGAKEAERRGQREVRILDALVVPILGQNERPGAAWRRRWIQGKPRPERESERLPADWPPMRAGGRRVPFLPAELGAGQRRRIVMKTE
jgi:hypothetical protein